MRCAPQQESRHRWHKRLHALCHLHQEVMFVLVQTYRAWYSTVLMPVSGIHCQVLSVQVSACTMHCASLP